MQELDLINRVKKMIKDEDENIFIPSTTWMIQQKTGEIPLNPLNPTIISNGNRVSIRPEIKGMNTIVFVKDSMMGEFAEFNLPKTNLYKIHNYGLAAISISFYKEHRYDTVKTDLEVTKDMLKTIDQKHVLTDHDEDYFNGAYTFFLSNYDKEHKYDSVFISGLSEISEKTIKKNSHIAKNKLNIIFLSEGLTEGELRHKNRYSNKVMDMILRESTELISLPRSILYAVKNEVWDEFKEHD